ncbi:GGDEF domain-containing protein [Uliginosibacterium sp. H1]|uniref:GGDEF domain-containing protein n=1 Tax=Uliginosibacterium sp. H1 TaxID=3114757 RepID=UPI002E18FA16|nr:GGDEF domain-containing protein [Uliginosibacterium sp. H1]
MAPNELQHAWQALPDDVGKLDRLEEQTRAWLAQAPRSLRFPAELDARFDSQGRPQRLVRLQRALGAVLVIFVLLGAVDLFLLPDILETAWLIRYAIVTPLVLVCLLWMPRAHWERLRESLVAGLILVMAATQVLFAILSDAAPVAQFDLLLILAMLIGNLVAQLRYRIAFGFTAGMLLLYLAQEAAHYEGRPVEQCLALGGMLVACIISLTVRRNLELERRIAFANGLLGGITQRRLASANENLSAQASSDPLTGLANRRELDERLMRLHRNAIRQQQSLSLLFIDVDYFKRFNDTYGHQAGDDCLRWLGGIFRDSLRRPMDMVARYGGEEFAVLLPDTPPDAARKLAEQLRNAVYVARLPHESSPHQRVTISIGVAGSVPNAGALSATLVQAADQALYLAKEEGRNCVVMVS